MYSVSVPGHGVFVCPARGLFRKKKETPIPGDMVVIGQVDREKETAYLLEILPRQSEILRPRAANITQALVVLSLVRPEVSFLVADTFLAYLHSQQIRPILCINKADITPEDKIEEARRLYAPAKYKIFTVCALTGQGFDDAAQVFPGNVTILAGPSGVGKSSIINALFPELSRETGELSEKIGRGKNTTRSCELFEAGGGYIADSPGFTSLDASLLPSLPKEGIDKLFPEFEPFLGLCYYGDCIHDTEHDCAVKEHIGTHIPRGRYENYTKLAKIAARKEEW